MTDVGSAEVEVTGDVRNFARQTERELNSQLARIDLDDVKVDIDTDAARRSGEKAGRQIGDGVRKGSDESLNKNKGGFASSLKKAFTPNPALFDSLRAPFAAALSTPAVAAAIAVAGTVALAFVGAFAAALATAGLGAVFLGVGAAALFGAKKSRDDAQKDLDAAEERVRKAEQRAQSGTAASKRSLADARAELAKAQEQVAKNQAFEKLDSSLTKLGNTLQTVAQKAAQPLLKPFNEAIQTLDKALVRIGPLLTTIFAGLAPAIGPLTQGIVGFVEEFLKVLTADPATLIGMKDALIALGANLPRIGTALGTLFALFASNENNVRNIGLLFGLLEVAIGQIATTITILSTVLDALVVAWNAVGSAISAAVGWITGTAIPAITSAASAVGAFFQGIGSAIAGFFTAAVQFFVDLPGRIMAAVAALPGLIGTFFSTMFDHAITVIGIGIGAAIALFLGLPGLIVSAIQALPGLVATVFTALWARARAIVSAGISAVVSFFAQLPGRARGAISALVGAVSSVISAAANAARTQATNLVNGAVNIIRNLPGKIRSALSSVRSAVTGAFAGAGGWLLSAGRRIIDGLVSGIKAGFGRVQGMLSSLTSMLPSWKGPAEVDRKILEQSGRLVMQGFDTGLRSGFRDIEKTLGDLTGDLPGFTAGPVRGGDGATARGNTYLTIEKIEISATDRAGGEEAAEAILERLGAATLAR